MAAKATVVPLDPADPQIFVQQSGTTAAGGDPNIITNAGSFVVGVQGGSFTEQNPLLIIVGAISGVPSISFAGCAIPNACPAATIGTYGLTANTATLSSGQDALSQLGLTGDGSESFVNWTGADNTHGFGTPSSYTLYAFALNTSLTSGNPITIDETGAANGSYIIAYDCNAGTGSNTGCSTNGNIGQTPFTNAGLLDATTPPSPVSEPSSLAILGAVFAGLGWWNSRRKRSGRLPPQNACQA